MMAVLLNVGLLKTWARISAAAAAANGPQTQSASDSADAQPTIVLAARDPGLVNWLQPPLARAGFAVQVASDREEALALAQQQQMDLLLIERQLPGDVLDLCRLLRSQLRVPIVIIAAQDIQDDIVAALDSGVDDVLTASCSPPEVVARVRGILRRAARSGRAVEH
jgi:DNA-binding response OmpR family regulator